ncbi:MAG: UDP-N-acetylmuramoyl-L-alanyl-D-glutamate--2,6-diaminopimelate ligase [Clostridiales bacterium]|nr:UDP-N-acetylmuramoyl-L-alanyl-D-glutamate--2,6-diaminopimelate ligase [Clostridiales bacterium]
MLLHQLLEGLPSVGISGNVDLEISDIIYDSRKVIPGCVFVCLVGSQVDSHQFAAQAVQNGAVAVIVSHPIDPVPATVVTVADTRYALACMSAVYFGHPARRLKTVGITGTKGKTTVSCMIKKILEKGGVKTGLIGTLGVVIGEATIKTSNTTPESYEIQKYLKQMADEGCGCAVIEASSLGLKWHRTAGFLYDYGVFTNFSPDHIGENEHASLQEYLECKRMLFRACKLGLVNSDDLSWREIIKGHTCALETFGFSSEAQLRGENEHLISRPGYLGAHFDVHGAMELSVDVDIPGKFSAYNALSAIAVCRHFPVTRQHILEGLNEVKVKGRVEAVPVPGEYTLLIDYAHNAMSMENILTTLREYQPSRLVCMFGAGGNRARSRRYEMGEISGRLADLTVITEDNSRNEDVMEIIEDIKTGMAKTNGEYVVIPDRKEAIRYCMDHAQPGDIVVLAGKGHEDYQEKNGRKLPFDERVVVAEILSQPQRKDG